MAASQRVMFNLHNPLFMRSSAAAGALLSSLVTFGVITGDKLLAGIVSLLCAALAAFLASLPAILKLRMQRRDKQIQFLERRIIFHAKTVRIVRGTKHEVITTWINDQDYARSLQQLLRDNKISFKDRPFINPMSYTLKEDQEIAALESAEDIHATEEA